MINYQIELKQARLESPMTINLKMELNTAGFVRGQTPAKDFKIA